MTVETADGDEIGVIETIEGSTARVKPHSSLSDSIRNRMGWSSEKKEAYELPHSKVDRFDDDVVRLKD